MSEKFAHDRSTGIGGSDAAAILGVSPWSSPLQVWMVKVGMTEGPEESEAMEWGTRLEPAVLAKFREETGYEVVSHDDAGLPHRHPEHSWLVGHVDGVYTRPDGRRGILEVKTANAYARDEWDEEAPLYYQIQLQHYMALTGLDLGAFAVLIGGNTYRWYEVVRNQEFIEQLIGAEEAFWTLVQSNTAPPATDQDNAALSRLYPSESDVTATVALPPESADWDEERREIIAQSKELDKRKDALDARIKSAIGEAAIGLLPAGGRYTWKLQQRKEYTVKASSSRVLRRCK